MRTSLKSVLVALVLITALVSAFAANNTTTVNVTSPLQVNGNKLEVGSYKVTWTANGEKADVVFKNGKNEVKTTAKIEDAKVIYSNTAVVKTTDGIMKQVWVGGRTTALIFSE